MISTERANQLKEIVASQREVMFSAADYIWKHPETGYREWKTHSLPGRGIQKLGYELVEAGNIPGFYTDIDTGKPGPKLLIMGELDSLIVSTHPTVTRRPAMSTPAATTARFLPFWASPPR